MTVDEMLNRMSSYEITEWQAFFSLEYKERQSQIDQRKMMQTAKSMNRRRF